MAPAAQSARNKSITSGGGVRMNPPAGGWRLSAPPAWLGIRVPGSGRSFRRGGRAARALIIAELAVLSTEQADTEHSDHAGWLSLARKVAGAVVTPALEKGALTRAHLP